MKLNLITLEEIMERAGLSSREREVMRLECAGPLEDAQIARDMGCSVSTVRNFRSRARRKVAAAQAAYDAGQIAEPLEDRDGWDISTPAGWYGFLLNAIRPPHRSDHGPNIGQTWTEYDHTFRIETTMSLEGAAHAGAMVTVGDLMGKRYPSRTAQENRDRLEKRAAAS